MSTYAELKSDIAYELARDDLGDRIPRFVRQAEQRIRREIRTSEMVRRARSFGNGTRYLLAPTGFLEMRRLWNVTDLSSGDGRSAPNSIQQVSPAALRHERPAGRLPRYFAVHRGDPPELEFDIALSSEREVEMVYYKAYDSLVEDSDTNALLQDDFDLYLEGALFYAAKAVKDNEESQARLAAYQAAKQELMRAERRLLYMQPMAATPATNSVG